jgi:hypothetical protein
MKLSDIIFMNLLDSEYHEVNLSKLDYLTSKQKRPKDWVESITDLYGGVIYGGYLEDRSALFDERHVTESTIHLGVDVWVPKNCSITFPHLHESKLLYRSSDVGYVGGWGGRKDYLYNDEVWLFAHLNPNHDLFLQDEPDDHNRIGRIGGKNVNGGWTPHLHIQRLTYDAYKKLDPDELDGYATPDDPIIDAHLNPFE